MSEQVEVDWDQHHRAHAKFVSHFITDAQVARLEGARSIRDMNMLFMSVADDLYHEVHDDSELLLSFDYDQSVGLRQEGAFWWFILECRLERAAGACFGDHADMGDIAVKIDRWLH